MTTRRRVFWLWKALIFAFGYIFANWVYASFVNFGIVYTAWSVIKMALMLVFTNAKVIILGPIVVAGLKDIKDFFS